MNPIVKQLADLSEIPSCLVWAKPSTPSWQAASELTDGRPRFRTAPRRGAAAKLPARIGSTAPPVRRRFGKVGCSPSRGLSRPVRNSISASHTQI